MLFSKETAEKSFLISHKFFFVRNGSLYSDRKIPIINRDYFVKCDVNLKSPVKNGRKPT